MVSLTANTAICVGTSGLSDGRRLKQFLLISIALHALAISVLTPPGDGSFAPPSVLEVRLARERQRQASDIDRERPAIAASRARTGGIAAAGETEPSGMPAPSPEQNTPEHPQYPAPPPPPTAAEVLLDSARRVARDEGRHLSPPKTDPGKFDDRPALPELARALARGKLPPGVTQFADGLLKVVTLSGAVYCLRPLPVLVRGGPVEPSVMPMTCP